MTSFLKMDIKDLFKRKNKNNINSTNNVTVKSIILKRLLYILLLVLIFISVYYFYLLPKLNEQEQKKFRLLNWENQIEICKQQIDVLKTEINELEIKEKKSSGLFVSNEEFETFYANLIEQTISYNLQITDITRGEDLPVYQENANVTDQTYDFEENNVDQSGISCNDGSPFMNNNFDNNMNNFDNNMVVQNGECDQSSGENCGNVAYYKMLVNYEITGTFPNYLNFRKLISSQSKIVNIENEEITKSEDNNGNILAKATVSLVRN